MLGVGPVKGPEQVGHIPGRSDGRGELRTAERAGRCLLGPLADAGEVAACVVACRTGEGHGAEVLCANDTLRRGHAATILESNQIE
jgi:hypothetical protein